MTFAVPRISPRTMPGNSTAPAARAVFACAISSLRMASTTARLAASALGRRRRCSSRWPSTWRSVSATNPRLAPSPKVAATRADGERAGVPQRIEQAGSGPQLPQSLFTPPQVIGLFMRRLEQQFAGSRRASHQGLSVVQRLRRHLAGMIHTHQRRGFAALGVVEAGSSGGGLACRPGMPRGRGGKRELGRRWPAMPGRQRR